MSLYAEPVDTNPIGFFRIFARPLGGTRREITMFRGAPIQLQSLSTSDPFTDSVGSFNLPQVTALDTPGQGDLDWLMPDADIDIVWQNTSHYDFSWRWEGYIASMDFTFQDTDTSISVQMKGALYALDSYRAQPAYPRRPIPYEILIQRGFDQDKYPARLGKLAVSFPSDWDKKVPKFSDPEYLSFLKPWGVSTGQKWTGLTSRSTGAWDPMLTGFVQSLLGNMFDESNSQWTIRNNGFRRPELYLRRPPEDDDPQILNITLGNPGVGISGSRDFTQMANVIYAQGEDLVGIQYSNMQVTPDGQSTYFLPYAWSPQTYPRTGNPDLAKTAMPKELQIKVQTGLDERAAYQVARTQLQRFQEPGLTGSITLTTDPLDNTGRPFPRFLIKAGRTIRIKNLFGIPEGVLVHVTQASVNFSDNIQVSLTYDSKYRDQLTVDEVQARTRDALDPIRSIQLGKFTNTTNDLVLPWSYADGSGCIPSGGGRNSKEFFLEKLPDTAKFPYEEWTKKYPPSKYPNYFIKFGPTNTTNSTKNWAVRSNDTGSLLIYPIKMSQAGTIKLTQIAAYDKNGNVMPVKFHVSIYNNGGVRITDLPQFPQDPEANNIPYLKPPGISVNYGIRQKNPWFKNAWETTMPDGTIPSDNPQAYVPAANANLVTGWGNYFEPAGFWPGRQSRGATRTGMLVDTTAWSYQMDSTQIDLQRPENNKKIEDAGMLFLTIYCDDQGDQPVFFMGRLLRQEAGQS